MAGLLITTEAMVAELPKKQQPAMPPGGGGGAWAAWTSDPLALRYKQRARPHGRASLLIRPVAKSNPREIPG